MTGRPPRSAIFCRPALFALALLTAGPTNALLADNAQSATTDRDMLDLVYLAPRKPIFVTLHIRSAGRGFFNQREEYAQKLFQELDQSGDGVLADDELAGIPPVGHLVPVGSRNTAAATSNMTPPDADNDGRVTSAEFTAYLFRASGAPFQISDGVQNLSDGPVVDLFDRLDRDGDERLSDAELASAARTLRLMDYNLDERIAIDEIRKPTVFGIVQSNDNSPTGQAAATLTLFEPVNRQQIDDALIRRMVQLYDKLSPGPRRGRFVKDGRLNAKELGLPEKTIAAFDANHDRALDQEELRDFLAHPQPVAEIFVEFGDDTTPPDVRSVLHDELPDDAPIRFSDGQGEDVRVGLNNIDFQLVAAPEQGTVDAARYQPFDRSDGDNNQYLDPNEFASAIGRFDTNQFELVDTDSDGMVVKSEFDSFIKHQVELQKHVIRLTLAMRGASLFPNVDRTNDGILEAAELEQLKPHVLELDRNQDGQLDREELTAAMQLIVSRGNLNTQSRVQAAPAVRNIISPRAVRGARGWFVRMDRNQDGEVSKREFLGPLEAFHKMDADGNGRLTADEAQK